jgi:hypothetical protein
MRDEKWRDEDRSEQKKSIEEWKSIVYNNNIII